MINKEMIRAYVDGFGGFSGSGESIDFLINNARREKDVRLNKLFNGELILEKQICIEKPIEIIQKDITDNLICPYSFTVEYSNIIYRIVRTHNYQVNGKELTMWSSEEDLLRSLIWSTELSRNRVGKEMNIVNIGTGKKLKISQGQKLMGAIKKVLAFFEADEDTLASFEEFRLQHSLILNDKKLTGTLCLSIHPMDYMTLSDNNNGWESCMSWIYKGCYRAGTLELMNCDNTIVAYLKSDSVELNFGHYSWNSKKWRQLIHLTDDILLSNKAYPYNCDAITKECLDWVKELATERLDMKFMDKYFDRSKSEDEGEIRVRAYTTYMYNDLENNSNSKFYLLETVISDLEEDETPFVSVGIGGTAYCVKCGEYEVRGENTLLCDNCDETEYCGCCGEECDEVYETEDGYVCSYCYEYNYTQCEECECVLYNDLVGWSEIEKPNGDIYTEGYYCSNCVGELEDRANEESEEED